MDNNQVKYFLSEYEDFKIGDAVKCTRKERIYVNNIYGEILFITGPYEDKKVDKTYYNLHIFIKDYSIMAAIPKYAQNRYNNWKISKYQSSTNKCSSDDNSCTIRNIDVYDYIKDLSYEIVSVVNSDNPKKIRLLEKYLNTILDMCELYILENEQSNHKDKVIKSSNLLTVKSLYKVYKTVSKFKIFYNEWMFTDDYNDSLNWIIDNITMILGTNNSIS